MHMIWMSLVLPGMLFVVWSFPEARDTRIWLVGFLIAIVCLIAVIGIDLVPFLSKGGKAEHGFMRALFAVIMATDLPVVAFVVGSAVTWMVSRRYQATPIKADQAIVEDPDSCYPE